MSAIISDGKLLLSATGTGYATGKRTLPAAPAGADVLVCYFRAYFEGFAASESANYGWDNAGCFGLSFNGTFPAYDASVALNAKTGFFGLTHASTAAATAHTLESAPGGWDGDTVRFGTPQFLTGKAAAPNGALASALTQAARLPHGATHGATFTGIWKITKAPSQQIVVSTGRNFESLALENISQALTSGETVWDIVNEAVTEASNWRPAEGTMGFPGYVLAKFTGGVAGTRFVLDHLKAEYWKANA